MRTFKPEELRYAATARCKCGKGLAYVWNDVKRKAMIGDIWLCSELLTRKIRMRSRPSGDIEDESGLLHDGSTPWIEEEFGGLKHSTRPQ